MTVAPLDGTPFPDRIEFVPEGPMPRSDAVVRWSILSRRQRTPMTRRYRIEMGRTGLSSDERGRSLKQPWRGVRWTKGSAPTSATNALTTGDSTGVQSRARSPERTVANARIRYGIVLRAEGFSS